MGLGVMQDCFALWQSGLGGSFTTKALSLCDRRLFYFHAILSKLRFLQIKKAP